jgi:hypothetical protein
MGKKEGKNATTFKFIIHACTMTMARCHVREEQQWSSYLRRPLLKQAQDPI